MSGVPVVSEKKFAVAVFSIVRSFGRGLPTVTRKRTSTLSPGARRPPADEVAPVPRRATTRFGPEANSATSSPLPSVRVVPATLIEPGT